MKTAWEWSTLLALVAVFVGALIETARGNWLAALTFLAWAALILRVGEVE